MASGSSTSIPDYLHISGISIDFSKSNKIIESAEVRLCGVPKAIVSERDASAGTVKKLYEKFDRPMKLSRGDAFSVRLCKKRAVFNKHEDINFDTADVFRAWANGTLRNQEYCKSHGKIAIAVRLVGNGVTSTSGEPVNQAPSEQAVSFNSSEETLGLYPTTDEIFRICPRFRILVIGKTGVGKSSIINHAFGVQKAFASNEQPGKADINTEHISPQNDKFVLHDSQGFEPSEVDNVKIVQEFIQGRKCMEALGDRLHTVWLCIEVPRAGGRLLETGTEEFLQLKNDGALGNIPVVVVLTKYDKFMDHVERTLNDNDLDDLSEDAFRDRVRQRADAELHDICAQPLKKFAELDIPYATVSTKETHKGMIARLIQITEERVCQHVASEASVMTSVAQRVDPKLKITTSIGVGKRKYWKALASATAFRGHTALACLEVLHTDIVRVWNFSDPHHYLDSKEFKTLMVTVVNHMDVGSIAQPNRTVTFGLSAVAAIAGITSALSGPAAPIVVPIMATVVIGKWVYDVYQLSRVVLRHFIAYIVDLTLILQTLYLVSDSQELSRRTIKLAVASYLKSATSADVHGRIQECNRHLPLSERADQDTLNQIVELMKLFSMEAKDISGLKAQIPAFGSGEDEQW